MTTQRPDIVTVIAKTHVRKTLIDFRVHRHFAIFGNIMRVAKQYGISAAPVEGGIIFSAPKSRMQIFIEKLHFSNIIYQEII